MKRFHQFLETMQQKCPRCEAIERRADLNIHQAKMEADASLLTFKSKINGQLSHLFYDVDDVVPDHVDEDTGKVVYQRLIEAKKILARNGILKNDN